MLPLLLRLLVLVALAAFLWWVFKERFDFTIRIVDGAIRMHGRLALAQKARIAHFFDHDLGAQSKLKILGRRGRDGRLVLRFRGAASEGDKQRIRNFLTDLLA